MARRAQTQRRGQRDRDPCPEFFEEYDNRFNPRDVARNPNMTSEEKKIRQETVRRVLETLVERRDIRAWTSTYGTVPPPSFLPRVNGEDVRHLSDAQLELFNEFFSGGDGDIDYEAFQICFEKFANGELRNPQNPGEREPDGGYFFLFAEFAFLAVAQAFETTKWKKLLRTFLKCQEIFMNTYRPSDPNPGLDDYGPEHFRAQQQATDARKRQLRRIYDDLSGSDLEKKATEIMRRAQGISG